MTADTQLRVQLQRELRHLHLTDHIQVHVEGGIVRLSGTVEHWAQRRAVEDAVLQVPGTRGFLNEVVVRFPVCLTVPDPQVADNVRHELARHPELGLDNVHSTVSAGWVRLTGRLDSEQRRRRAERVVSAIPGVRSVTNDIAVQVRV